MDAFVTSNGAQLYARSDGPEDAPVLLFIHAGIADHSMWNLQVEAFKDRYRILRYDMRNFGRTESTEAHYRNEDDALAVLDYFGAAHATLIGCSRGGAIALDTALAHPGRVSALVSVCGGMGGLEYRSMPEDPREVAWVALSDTIEATEKAGDPEALADLETRMWMDGLAQPEGRCPEPARGLIRAMIAANYRAHPRPLGTALQLAPAAATRLNTLDIPVLAVFGAYDEPYTEQAMQALAAGAPKGRLHVFEQAAHVPSMELPEAFNALLAEFLAESGR
jgi:pimeloyl-ACP methyl ester carboxylesterase